MRIYFRLSMAVFWGVILSFVAVEAAFACNPETEPCSVVFTLDDQNNMILKTVEASNRTEGVLRLTTLQAQKAAVGPLTTHNILKPATETQETEFAETIARLAAIPGLQFLADPTAAQKAANGAEGKAGEAMALSGATSGENQMCAQMHLVLKATLEEATSAAFDPTKDYMSPREIRHACGEQAAAKMIQWYEAEQQKRRPSL